MSFTGQQTIAILAALTNGELTAKGVIEKVHANTQGRIKIFSGSIYTQLDRLEKIGLIQGHYSEAKPAERGGRPRRHYELLAAGQLALNDLDLIRGIRHA